MPRSVIRRAVFGVAGSKISCRNIYYVQQIAVLLIFTCMLLLLERRASTPDLKRPQNGCIRMTPSANERVVICWIDNFHSENLVVQNQLSKQRLKRNFQGAS